MKPVRKVSFAVFTAALALLPVLAAQAAESRLDLALAQIHQNFWQEIPREELEDRALRALVRELDPYGQVLDAAELEQFRGDFRGTVAGVGLVVHVDEGSALPQVEALLIGSAAGAAGVRRGDHLESIDGHSLKGLDIDQVLALLRGEVGSDVRLAVSRAGEGVHPLVITRKIHPLPSVHGVGRDPAGKTNFLLDAQRGIGYIRVAHLADDSLDAVRGALDQLTAANARGLILDLRASSGGLMAAGVGIADLFLAAGVLAGEESRTGSSHRLAEPAVAWAGPLVVLIDSETASSSEFLAAALRDTGRATFVGTRTFGKGRVQRVFALGEGEGGLVLTTGRHLRPAGVASDRHDPPPAAARAGVTPDPGWEIEIEGEELERWRKGFDLRGSPAIYSQEELAAAGPDPILDRAVELLAGKVWGSDDR